jgi:hypothetical protein
MEGFHWATLGGSIADRRSVFALRMVNIDDLGEVVGPVGAAIRGRLAVTARCWTSSDKRLLGPTCQWPSASTWPAAFPPDTGSTTQTNTVGVPSRPDLERAMAGHILAQAELIATFEKARR